MTFEFVEIRPVYRGFGAVADRLEFDVGELALATYILARRFERPLVALPIFVSRNFFHDRIVYHTRSGIQKPKDLEGKRVGVRAYSQTAPVWNRGILQSEYDVDLDRVTWVVLEDPHVGDYRNPPNVVQAPGGKSLAELLLSGEIDAADGPGKIDSPDIKRLIPNGDEVEAEWFKRTGIYPVGHIVVVKREVVRARPTIIRELFDAFTAAKNGYIEQLDDPAALSAADGRSKRMRSIVGKDFLPYGIAPNRKAIELLCEFTYRQKIAPKLYRVEDLFGPEVLDLE